MKNSSLESAGSGFQRSACDGWLSDEEEAKGLSKIESEDNPLRLQMRFVLVDYTMQASMHARYCL
jgi:hypothetical protein